MKDIRWYLNYIGSAVLVKYYYDFKFLDAEECVEKIEEPYTIKSKRSRTSKARQMFREGRNIEALECIAASAKLDPVVVNRATGILKEEKVT